jgi:hypothetical protein
MDEADKTVFWSMLALIVVSFLAGADAGCFLGVLCLISYLLFFSGISPRSRHIVEWQWEYQYRMHEGLVYMTSLRTRPVHADASHGEWVDTDIGDQEPVRIEDIGFDKINEFPFIYHGLVR